MPLDGSATPVSPQASETSSLFFPNPQRGTSGQQQIGGSSNKPSFVSAPSDDVTAFVSTVDSLPASDGETTNMPGLGAPVGVEEEILSLGHPHHRNHPQQR